MVTYALHMHLDEESAEVIHQVQKLWKVPKVHLIALAWPRCPKCNGPLVQKFASRHLICAKCETEFRLEEVKS